jgi:hypothetical protein
VVSGLFSVNDPGSNLNPRKIIADATKATSGPGTTKKPVTSGDPSKAAMPAAKAAAKKRTKVSAS